MVVLNKIYTRTGDDGTTALGTGERRKKFDAAHRRLWHDRRDQCRDRRGAAVYARQCRARCGAGAHPERSVRCRRRSVHAGQNRRQGRGGARLTVTDNQVAWLEAEIDRLNAELSPLRSFVLPGGSAAAAYLHLARTICRRAERLIAELAATARRARSHRQSSNTSTGCPISFLSQAVMRTAKAQATCCGSRARTAEISS